MQTTINRELIERTTAEVDPMQYSDLYILGLKNRSKKQDRELTIKGVEFSEIVCEIYKKWSEKDCEIWLKRMMERHGMSSEGLDKKAMVTSLFILAGVSTSGGNDSGLAFLIGTLNHFYKKYPILWEILKIKIQEKQEFFFRNAEADPAIETLLLEIEKIIGPNLNRFNIFEPKLIPNYVSRKISHNRSYQERNLQSCLFEIYLALSGVKPQEISRQTKREAGSIYNYLQNKGDSKMLTLKIRVHIATKQGWEIPLE
jgi:hypothetical protein